MIGPFIDAVLLFLFPDLLGWSVNIYLLVRLIHERKHLKVSTKWVWMWGIAWVLMIVGFSFNYLELIGFAPLLWIVAWLMFRRSHGLRP